jgi:membrane-bound lytic murein transglycosylase B
MPVDQLNPTRLLWQEKKMLTRRLLLAGAASGFAASSRAAPESFQAFLGGVRTEARRAGISAATLDRAFAELHPNPRVIELDRKQPEFVLTWEQYRTRVISDQRIADGKIAWRQNFPLLQSIHGRYGVDPRVIIGIWGLESNFGTKTGGFQVIEALATLAWEGRRAAFFRGELMAALKILEHGDISPARMTGSYAGAMGQPQFMPSSYLRLAVDFDGDGRRDIWNSRADALGSIGNYLQKSGWRDGETWGQEILLPDGFSGETGRDHRRPLGEWLRQGIKPVGEKPLARAETPAAIILPDGATDHGGAAFFAYGNFGAIRRYNPSDFYALAVGLIGDQVAA